MLERIVEKPREALYIVQYKTTEEMKCRPIHECCDGHVAERLGQGEKDDVTGIPHTL